MSIAESTTIDLVTRVPGDPDRAVLLIYDNRNYMNDIERETALQRKLSAYLMFVESGKFTETYPELANAELSVEVVCLRAPTTRMKLIDSIQNPHCADSVLRVVVYSEEEFRTKWHLPKTST